VQTAALRTALSLFLNDTGEIAMITVITDERVKQYAHVLTDMLAAAEAQTQGRVRRPRREVVDLLDAMTNVCIMLTCQVRGGPQPRQHDIASIKLQAARLISGVVQ
jgi:hypothetical protein